MAKLPWGEHALRTLVSDLALAAPLLFDPEAGPEQWPEVSLGESFPVWTFPAERDVAAEEVKTVWEQGASWLHLVYLQERPKFVARSRTLNGGSPKLMQLVESPLGKTLHEVYDRVFKETSPEGQEALRILEVPSHDLYALWLPAGADPLTPQRPDALWVVHWTWGGDNLRVGQALRPSELFERLLRERPIVGMTQNSE